MLIHKFESKVKGITKIIAFAFSFNIFFVCIGKTAEIVVNKSVIQNTYSLNLTRDIFTMKQRYWSNGERIIVFTLTDNHPLHKTFTKNKLQMFPHQLRRVWDRMVFSGTGQAPKIVQTEEEMLGKIANTPNAIGYLVNRTDNEEILLFEYP